MTPIEPHDAADNVPSIAALLTAVKPIYWGGVVVASLVWGAAQFAGRVESIEQDVRVIKLILCAQATAAADSYCRGTP